MTEGTPSSVRRPPLVRRREGRLAGGVATGVAEHLGVPLVAVRVVFALLAVNGIGALAYIALWVLIPSAGGVDEGAWTPKRLFTELVESRPDDVPHRRTKLLAYLLLGSAVGSLLGALGMPFGRDSLAPLSVAMLGALLIWWRAPDERRDRWASGARRVGAHLRRRDVVVAVCGIVLVVAGVAAFLAAHDALAQARSGALAIGATVVGVLLVTGPWLLRLIRELTAERTARIREQERAEVAAHLHDSVLQTLALIQSMATDPDDVRRLARSQERELREWLYGGAAATGVPSLAAALRQEAAEVEDLHGVPVEVVMVGDAPLDEHLQAAVAATREAMVNAAKSSGAAVISVYAEVSADAVEVFVRDRGRGFDLEHVPPDRRGIRESIVGRMARAGGVATVRTGPAGTEVALSMSRAAT